MTTRCSGKWASDAVYEVPESLQSIQQEYLDCWMPPERLSICDWSERSVFLSERNSPQAGPLRLWSYQRGMLEAMADPEIPFISIMKASRVGFTRCLMCTLAHFAANRPCSVALLEPSLDDARKTSIFEITPLFEESPALRDLLHHSRPGPARASDPDTSTLTMKLFPGAGSLRILSAGSPKNLRAIDLKVLLADEIDAFPLCAEGDALELCIKRTFAHFDRKIICGSSPTFESASVVERRYAESDQRIFEIPHTCGKYFELLWEHIHYPPDNPLLAHAVCPHCHSDIDESEKENMVSAGAWRITRPDIKGHAGFRLNALVSLFANASWGLLAAEYERAKKSGPSLMQVFVNTVEGRPYRLQVDSVDQSFLRSKCEDFSLEALPEQVLLLTCGVDTQMGRLELIYLGHGLDGTVFILGHEVLYGATNSGAPVWKQLDTVLSREYRHPRGYMLKVEATAIDSGGTGSGTENRTEAVYDFCRIRHHRRIYPIKAVAGVRPFWTTAETNSGQWLVCMEFVCLRLFGWVLQKKYSLYYLSLRRRYFDK
jgi:phage terminase large subunit GpA-like protein